MTYVNTTPVPVKFGGGLNTLGGLIGIGDDESPNCKNVHSNQTKILSRRKGYEQLALAANGSAGNGIFDFWKDATTHYLMAYIDTYLYKVDSVGGAFDSTLDSVAFGSAMSDALMEFVQFNDAGVEYLVMSTRDRDVLQKWTGTGATSDLSADGDLPAGKHIESWKGFLFIANTASYPSRIYRNDVSGTIVSATAWSATDYEEIRTNDGDYVTALRVFKGRLYTFKQWSIHRWTYFGGTPLFGIKEAIAGVGTVSAQSIIKVNHPKYGEILAFLAEDKRFYGFDGSQIIPISNKIELDNRVSEFYLNKMNNSYTDLACGVDYKDRHWAVWSVPTTSYNNWVIVWDYYTDSWWPMDGYDMRCCTLAKNSGKKSLFFIPDDGKVYKFDSGDDDATSNINANYETSKLSAGDNTMLKSMKHMAIQITNIPDSTLDVYTKCDWKTTWGTAESISLDSGGFILGSSILGSALGGAYAKTSTIDLPVINSFIQHKFNSNNSDAPWTIYAADMVASAQGHGGSSTET